MERCNFNDKLYQSSIFLGCVFPVSLFKPRMKIDWTKTCVTCVCHWLCHQEPKERNQADWVPVYFCRLSVAVGSRHCPCCYSRSCFTGKIGLDSCLLFSLIVLDRYVDLQLQMRCTLVSSDKNSFGILAVKSHVFFWLFRGTLHADMGRMSFA